MEARNLSTENQKHAVLQLPFGKLKGPFRPESDDRSQEQQQKTVKS